MKSLIHYSGVALAASLLAGCLFVDDDTENGWTYETRILEIDREAHTITSQYNYWYCEGETAVHDSDFYPENYLISGGKLYRWESDYGCMGTAMSGSSSDIVGNWVAGVYESPPVDDSAFCDDLAHEDLANMKATIRKLKISEKITETKSTVTITGERCFGENTGYMLTTNMGSHDDDFEASEKNCSSVKITRASDSASVRLVGEETSTGVKMKFITADTTCTAILPKSDATEPVCTDGGAEKVFEDCVSATDFFGESPILKASAEVAARKHRMLRSLRQAAY
jgi:hypothetical protein